MFVYCRIVFNIVLSAVFRIALRAVFRMLIAFRMVSSTVFQVRRSLVGTH